MIWGFLSKIWTLPWSALTCRKWGHISELGRIFLLSDSEKVLLATSKWFSMLGRLVETAMTWTFLSSSDDSIEYLKRRQLNYPALIWWFHWIPEEASIELSCPSEDSIEYLKRRLLNFSVLIWWFHWIPEEVSIELSCPSEDSIEYLKRRQLNYPVLIWWFHWIPEEVSIELSYPHLMIPLNTWRGFDWTFLSLSDDSFKYLKRRLLNFPVLIWWFHWIPEEASIELFCPHLMIPLNIWRGVYWTFLSSSDDSIKYLKRRLLVGFEVIHPLPPLPNQIKTALWKSYCFIFQSFNFCQKNGFCVKKSKKSEKRPFRKVKIFCFWKKLKFLYFLWGRG